MNPRPPRWKCLNLLLTLGAADICYGNSVPVKVRYGGMDTERVMRLIEVWQSCQMIFVVPVMTFPHATRCTEASTVIEAVQHSFGYIFRHR